ncbi:unnamed protein product [Larinioides sclopetarius]|uniref:Uncharacterized protein n=1 Tax=Larinioides sclopetarius TaxID=280406 RepID=A0AAV2A3N3_9ARAC
MGTADIAEKVNRAKASIKSNVTKLETFLESADKASVAQLQIKIKTIEQLLKKLDEVQNEFFTIKDVSGLQETANDFEQVDSGLEELEMNCQTVNSCPPCEDTNGEKRYCMESSGLQMKICEAGAKEAWQRSSLSNKPEDSDTRRLTNLMKFLKGEADGEERLKLARSGFDNTHRNDIKDSGIADLDLLDRNKLLKRQRFLQELREQLRCRSQKEYLAQLV